MTLHSPSLPNFCDNLTRLGCCEAGRQIIFQCLNDPDSLNCLVLARPQGGP